MKQVVTLIYDTETQELKMEAKEEKDLEFFHMLYHAFSEAKEDADEADADHTTN